MTVCRRRWLLLALVAVAVVCALLWWPGRRRSEPSIVLIPTPVGGQVPISLSPPQEAVAEQGSRTDPLPPAKPNELPGLVSGDGAAPAPSLDDLPRMTPNATDQFTATDIAHGEMPVVVDFGDYAVQVGDEFEVAVTLTAPALKTLAIPMAFDPTKLAVVENSAHERTNVLRGRMEFYPRNDKGMIGLLVSGFPGLKNTHECNGEVVAAFKLRALATGSVTLELLQPGVQVVSATTDLTSRATINPPRIVIR